MEKLKELHQQVKDHPFKLSGGGHLIRGYELLLYRLSHEFYIEVKKTKFADAKNMVHDWNAAINNLGRKNYKYQDTNDLHVENCISVVHELIEEGKVSKYYTHYPGGGIFAPLGAIRKFVWDEEISEFYLEVPKERVGEVVDFIRSFIKKLNGSSQNELTIKNTRYWEEFIGKIERFNK